MTVCWFAQFRHTTPELRIGAGDFAALRELVATTPGLDQGIIYTPASTSDPYLNDGPPPQLALQLYFNDIAALEAAVAANAHLEKLAVPSLGDANVTQQAMVVRRFPVSDPIFRTPQEELPCTYLVAYEGPAEDPPAWLAYYIADHPPIMARFPGIRQIEIYTCMDWCGSLPWPRVAYMQRNKVVFDHQAALTAALNSPVRHEMRASFHKFPPFRGEITHFPMQTTTVAPRCQ